MNSSNKLYKKARFYRDSGYAVIPIRGAASPGRPKAAAVRWSAFQHRLPTDDELTRWFVDRRFGGLAIVCGRVSQLAVLDFDDEQLAAEFAVQFPHLTRTRIVRSGGRGLPHYYFHITQNLNTRSRHSDGVDWQYDGAYVIAPPTTLGGSSWQVVQNVEPLSLSERDLGRIHDFLDAAAVIERESAPMAVSVRGNSSSSGDTPTENDLVRHYRAHAPNGRNNALFRTACWHRDNGGSMVAASALIEAHVHQPANGAHSRETLTERRDEALKTLASAFSRAPVERADKPLTVIPNALRERLLSEKQTAVLRVLETIHKAGWEAGQTFTRPELLDICRDVGVGDWSVRKALSAMMAGDDLFFPEVANAADAACLDGVKTPQLNAIELRVSGPTQNATEGRGRPPTLYVVPSLRAVCKHYEITVHAGDALDIDALGSVKDYREALHQALLARRPGSYHREWLAERLGVSVRTICRYNTSDQIRVAPRYIERRVLWGNLAEAMPADLHDPSISHFGAFLEDDTGKRYPPFVAIARRLLRQRRKVVFKRRVRNHYSIANHLAEVRSAAKTTVSLVPAVPARAALSGGDTDQFTGMPQRCIPRRIPTSSPDVSARCVPVRSSLNEADMATVQSLYNALDGAMSRKRAEQLVMTYGRFAVRDVLETLGARRESVRHPAGFVVRLLNARHGDDGNEATAAEGLFLALQRDGRALISWDRARGLVSAHGADAVADALRALRGTKAVRNPVGFVMSVLANDDCSTTGTDHAVDALMTAFTGYSAAHRLSRRNARMLVRQYGGKHVQRALRVLEARSGIENPVGFVISYLRSSAPKAVAG